MADLRAYALYRLNKYTEALEAVKSLKSDKDVEEFAQHLEGQVQYRLNKYDKCVGLYNELHEKALSPEDAEDVRVNLLAAHVSAAQMKGNGSRAATAKALESTGILAGDAESEATEWFTLFNLAAAYLEAGKLERAEALLGQAKVS